MTGAERLTIPARALDAAYALLGSCRHLYEVAHEAEINDIDFCRELDLHVFLCEVCGWWCSAEDELHEGMICEECDISEGGC